MGTRGRQPVLRAIFDIAVPTVYEQRLALGARVGRSSGRATERTSSAQKAVPSLACRKTLAGPIIERTESGRLASYRINGETGALTPLATYDVGRRPMSVLAIRLGD